MKKPTFNLTSRFAHREIIAVCIGIVYLWLGMLKFFPSISPAENLAIDTIYLLTFGLVPANLSLLMIAFWETAVGLMLIFNFWKRWAVMLALCHITFTFTPMIFFPEDTFSHGPFQLTMLGQYIVKNIIIVGALITLLNRSKRVA